METSRTPVSGEVTKQNYTATLFRRVVDLFNRVIDQTSSEEISDEKSHLIDMEICSKVVPVVLRNYLESPVISPHIPSAMVKEMQAMLEELES